MQPGSARRATIEMGSTIRQIIRELDLAIPVRESSPGRASLGCRSSSPKWQRSRLNSSARCGLLLSVTGTFGLASYTVSKRLRELSIRVALGAQARRVLSAALGRMLIVLATGSAAGILLGVTASRVLSAVVYQATAQDPVVLIAVAFTVLVTGSLSVAGPVRRALHVDPANLLREE